MRAYRARKKVGGLALLPKSLVRRLGKQGITVRRYLSVRPVSLDDYGDLKRRLEAKEARVEWQSGGIKELRDEIATLTAKLGMLQVQLETDQVAVLQRRVALLEAEQVVRGVED